jgi:hypothetical protein
VRQCPNYNDLYAKAEAQTKPRWLKGFSSLELKELKGHCGKKHTLRIGTVDLVDVEFRLKKTID